MSEEKKDNQEAPEAVAVPDKFKNADGSINTEAMTASYVELEQDRSRRVSELDTLKKANEQATENAKISDALEAIKANTTPAEKTEPSFDEYMAGKAAELAEEMGLEPDDPAVKMAVKLNSEAAKATSSWMKDSEKALKEQYDSKFEALETRFTADKSDRVKSTDDYIANKAEIDGLTGAGMDEGKAIQYVLTKAANASDTSAPPPSTVNGRVTAPQSVSEYWDSPEQREEMVRLKGEDRTKAMEATGLSRMGGE